MVKDRLIFTLLWNQGNFMLSRNFRLQCVGNHDWLCRNYNFPEISKSLDELIVLNVSRGKASIVDFAADLKKVTANVFLPVSAGGGIRSVDDGRLLLRSGADKLVVNRALFKDSNLVGSLVRLTGRQCLVGSVDYRINKGAASPFIDGGTEYAGLSLSEAICVAEDAGAGELYIHSIDRDGTGSGFDIDVLEILKTSNVPVIFSGGAGHKDHFLSGFRAGPIHAYATSNLFNFIGSALENCRNYLIQEGVRLAHFH